MPVTLKDVAERAGVSRSAVSRTFTPGASVSEKTRRKVETAAQELGYSPNALASSLTTGRTKLIGLVSNNFRNPYFLEIFDLFTRGLQDRGLRPLLVNLSDEPGPEASLRMLRQYSVDGVVVASSTLPPTFSRAFLDAGMPVVHAFGRAASSAQVHVVGIDNVASGRLAAHTLLSRGYRRIAFLGGPEGATTTQDRLAGFLSELKTHPEARVTHSFAGAYSFDAGREEMTRLLAEGDPAEAYFCGDDVLSIGALSALRDSGHDCPGQVGILGLNDMEMARWNIIDLTTLRQPIERIVASSIDLMVATLENHDRSPEARVFSCTVVDRGTLRPAPAITG
ncbi:LacI family DNA-binding transcriptional regulator [Pseudoponticoccus marisrubri]|uniref:Transcriptional regulator n=1 Tax=Pseudoponticoccus marisrubri TaxID=1685382 RepID=A0A0W7WF69_9RHOB|nr:LacI family DNA-binding transcriptional regulator [Pseudoponticoccus marisrubri]KUF09206.1 transcriptional regulator [Pseudoponticoccus marisrubri]